MAALTTFSLLSSSNYTFASPAIPAATSGAVPSTPFAPAIAVAPAMASSASSQFFAPAGPSRAFAQVMAPPPPPPAFSGSFAPATAAAAAQAPFFNRVAAEQPAYAPAGAVSAADQSEIDQLLADCAKRVMRKYECGPGAATPLTSLIPPRKGASRIGRHSAYDQLRIENECAQRHYHNKHLVMLDHVSRTVGKIIEQQFAAELPEPDREICAQDIAKKAILESEFIPSLVQGVEKISQVYIHNEAVAYQKMAQLASLALEQKENIRNRLTVPEQNELRRMLQEDPKISGIPAGKFGATSLLVVNSLRIFLDSYSRLREMSGARKIAISLVLS